MSDTKFSAGPWRAITEGGCTDIVDAEDFTLAEWVSQQDAHLIAAAPCLYGALRLLVDSPDIADNDYKDEETIAAERLALAALRKARGEA